MARTEIRDAVAAVGHEPCLPRRPPAGAHLVRRAPVVVAIVAGRDCRLEGGRERNVHPLELRPRFGVARIERERAIERTARFVRPIRPLPGLRERHPGVGVLRLGREPPLIAIDGDAEVSTPGTRLRREERGVPLLGIRREHAVAERHRLIVVAAPCERPRQPNPAIIVAGGEAQVESKHRLGATKVVPPRKHGGNPQDRSGRRRVTAENVSVARESFVVLTSTPRRVSRLEALCEGRAGLRAACGWPKRERRAGEHDERAAAGTIAAETEA